MGGSEDFPWGQFEIVAKKARSSPLPPARLAEQHKQSLPKLQVPNCLLFMRFLAFLPLDTNSYAELIYIPT